MTAATQAPPTRRAATISEATVRGGHWKHAACGTVVVWVATVDGNGYIFCGKCLQSPPHLGLVPAKGGA